MLLFDYFSIDEALARSERVSVRTRMEIHALGLLDTTSASQELQKGATVYMPLWFADRLLEPNFITVRTSGMVTQEKELEMITEPYSVSSAAYYKYTHNAFESAALHCCLIKRAAFASSDFRRSYFNNLKKLMSRRFRLICSRKAPDLSILHQTPLTTWEKELYQHECFFRRRCETFRRNRRGNTYSLRLDLL